MSEETSSVSSIEFIRSVASDEAGIYPRDEDEIFKFEQDRDKSVIQAPEIKSSLEIDDLPLSEDNEDKTPPGVEPWRIFLNYVDTFNTKYIAKFLAERVVGSLRVKEEEIDEEFEALGEGEEEEYGTKKKEEIPKQKYIIIGSLKDNQNSKNGETKIEGVSEIVDTSDRDALFKVLKTCGFIIYDISRYPDQIDEARWVLHKIEDELQAMKKDTPKAFSELKDVPKFILISTFMTWARSKRSTSNNPKKRKCHPNYKDHALLEREVDSGGKKFPDKFNTLVLCSGLQYGFEEDGLNFLFQMAWENSPALPLYTNGKNCIPLIHIRDLASMIFNVIEEFPQTRKNKILLAVEREISNLKNITKAISKGFTTGEITKMPADAMKASQHVHDCLTANERMQPFYFMESETMTWSADAPFPKNMPAIVDEYREARNLIAIRVLVTGPPASGKTTLSKKLCDYYKLHYLNPQVVTDKVIQKLKDKIDRIKAKEMANLANVFGEDEEEEEDEGEEEYEEEEEEQEGEDEDEDEESIEELSGQLDALETNMMENDGELDHEHLLSCLKEVLHSPPILNQGFVLDDFPNTIEDMKKVFKGGVKPHRENDDLMFGGEAEYEDYPMEEQEEDAPPDAAPYPDFIIALEASDTLILNRVMSLSEDTIKELQYEEENIIRRLNAYRDANTDDAGVLDFLDEREIHPNLFDVDEDKSEYLNHTFEKVKKLIGEPRNFGLSPEEIADIEKMTKEQQAAFEACEAERKKAVLRQAEEERLKNFDLWDEAKEVLRKVEEEKFKEDRLAFRKYLETYIYPVLIPSLQEVARVRPIDPLDYVAEYLLKENPEGRIFDPEKTRATRRAFEEMYKSRDTMFSINALDKNAQAELYTPEIGSIRGKSILENVSQNELEIQGGVRYDL